jgi:hypothetical protein
MSLEVSPMELESRAAPVSLPPLTATAVAASVGAIADAVTSNPFHVLKTRMQLDVAARPRLAAHLGALGVRGSMRGVGLNIVATGVRRAWNYTAHQALLERAGRMGLCATPCAAELSAFVVGVLTGASEGLLTNPLRRCMLLQQSQSHGGEVSSVAQAARYVWRRDGAAGFWRGSAVTMVRNGWASGVYFGLLFAGTGALPRAPRAEGSIRRDLGAAMVAGTGSVLASQPLDTLRSRIQDAMGRKVSLGAASSALLREGGARAFMKGTVANVVRGVPSTAVGFVVMRQLLPWLASPRG